MDMTNQEYGRYVSQKAKPSPLWKNLLWAFVTGGLICTGGQALLNLFRGCGLNENAAGTAVSVTIIFLAALFTGLGLFDKLAKHAGGGHAGTHHRICQRGGLPGAGIQVRGAGHGRGRQDVCDRRAGAGLRHQRLRALRRDSPALFPGIKSGKRGAAQAAPLFPSGLQKIEAIQTKTLDKRDGR